MVDLIGEDKMRMGYDMNIWGSTPGDYCTSNQFFGCERSSNGNKYINPLVSGRLRSVNSFSIKYGRVEFRAKLPKGDWLWPALWMLPAQNAYGSWPVSGEIDIVESRGNAAGYPPGGVDTFSSTLHWGTSVDQNKY